MRYLLVELVHCYCSLLFSDQALCHHRGKVRSMADTCTTYHLSHFSLYHLRDVAAMSAFCHIPGGFDGMANRSVKALDEARIRQV